MSVGKKDLRNLGRIVYSDELVTMIEHPKPMSKYHFVVAPNEMDNFELCKLTKKNLGLIEHMRYVAGITISRRLHNNNVQFVYGFESGSEECILQMHVVSTDFAGKYMQTEEFWNSFTTNLFIPIDKVIDDLKSKGQVQILKDEQIENIKNGKVLCLNCDKKFAHFDNLKNHMMSDHHYGE